VVFSSYEFFAFFLPAVLIAVALAGRRHTGRGQLVVLALASLLFYGWWRWSFLPLLLASVGFNFVWARHILRRGSPRAARWTLAFGVSANLFLLGWYKYRAFVAQNLNAVFGTHFDAVPVELPLAISFFTFQQIAYLVDTHRDGRSESNPVRFAAFVSFFPQLIAGPIVRRDELIPQLGRRHRFTSAALAEGLAIFTIGLFKKAVLADTLGPAVDPLFLEHSPVGFLDAWLACTGSMLQIYFDFAGYSDMAVGLGVMLGIRLPDNFASPLKAVNINELWSRWHMTLTRFFRDYLYIPLGGNRVTRPRHIFNVMAMMLLIGVWHGASWAFVLVGLTQGVGVAIHALWTRTGIAIPSLLSRAITLVFFMSTAPAFRGSAPEHMESMWKAMVGFSDRPFGAGSRFSDADWVWILGGLAIALLAPNRQQIMKWPWRSDVAYVVVFGVALASGLLFVAGPVPFWYFQF